VKEQKSPARGDFTPFEPPAGRRRLEAQERISPSAEGDLRRCLKKPPPFEKGGRKLSRCCYLKKTKIFERSEKINLSFCRRQIIILAKRDYHSAEGGLSFGASRQHKQNLGAVQGQPRDFLYSVG
jgi:hypothetical protein